MQHSFYCMLSTVCPRCLSSLIHHLLVCTGTSRSCDVTLMRLGCSAAGLVSLGLCYVVQSKGREFDVNCCLISWLCFALEYGNDNKRGSSKHLSPRSRPKPSGVCSLCSSFYMCVHGCMHLHKCARIMCACLCARVCVLKSAHNNVHICAFACTCLNARMCPTSDLYEPCYNA
jgi:hypothetical protein